jgi:DNA-binding transcriptional ArsR family regulator
VLGNPTAYEILKALAKGRCKPTVLAAQFGLSVPTISAALKSLRQLDLVRYETLPDGKEYFIKDPVVLTVLNHMESLVKRIRGAEY